MSYAGENGKRMIHLTNGAESFNFIPSVTTTQHLLLQYITQTVSLPW